MYMKEEYIYTFLEGFKNLARLLIQVLPPLGCSGSNRENVHEIKDRE